MDGWMEGWMGGKNEWKEKMDGIGVVRRRNKKEGDRRSNWRMLIREGRGDARTFG